RAWVDQICVLDTGSNDETIEIARSFGADVAEAQWEDDFSLARNASLAMAKHSWILVIDADEALEESTGPKLREVAESTGEIAFLLVREDLRSSGPSDRIALVRIFKNDPLIRFNRTVHESVMESLFALGCEAPNDSGVRLVHYGYLPDALRGRDKQERNLALLRRNLAAAPEDLYGAFKLAVTLPLGDRKEKLDAFGEANAMAERLALGEREQMPFLPTLYDAHASTLAGYGELSRAVVIIDRGRQLYPSSAQLQYRRGELARRIGDLDMAEPLLRGALGRPPVSAIEVDRSAQLDAACCVSLLSIAQETGRAVDLVKEGFSRYQENFSVRMGMLRLLLARGRVLEASQGLESLLSTHFHDDDLRLFGGELAFMQREFDTAFALWSLTQPITDAGHRAESWLDLLAIRRGEFPRHKRAPRDVASAAMSHIAARVGGFDFISDTAFRADALSRWTDRWLSELSKAGDAHRSTPPPR
ncbi:MAG TPA: glycosyltransferase, partial [Polyangiaceae bacterium]